MDPIRANTAPARARTLEEVLPEDDGRSTRPPHLRVVASDAERSDEDLMLAHGRGDAGAFDLLVRRHRGRIFGHLRRMGHGPDRAEELVGDVFLKLHRAAPRYEPRARFTTFLHTVTYRASLNALAKSRNQLDRTVAEPAHLEAPAPDVASLHPEKALTTRRAFDRLDAELAELSEEHRRAFVLYYSQGLSCAEIADLLDVSAAEVKGRLAYARKLLRTRLQPWLSERNG